MQARLRNHPLALQRAELSYHVHYVGIVSGDFLRM